MRHRSSGHRQAVADRGRLLAGLKYSPALIRSLRQHRVFGGDRDEARASSRFKPDAVAVKPSAIETLDAAPIGPSLVLRSSESTSRPGVSTYMP